MGQTEKIIAGLEPPALEGLTRAPFPTVKGVKKFKVTQDGTDVPVAYHKGYATFEFNPYGGEIIIKH